MAIKIYHDYLTLLFLQALLLYKKYLELREKGTFGSVLEDIYEMGRKSNWLKSAPKDSNGTNSPAIFKR
jgi:hypothetical protein